MKKINILWMLIGCLFLVTSCSDDDDSAVASLQVIKSDVSFTAIATTGTIEVQSNSAITAVSNQDGCTVTVNGNVVTVAVPTYTGLVGRNAVVEISNTLDSKVRVPVSQAGGVWYVNGDDLYGLSDEESTITIPVKSDYDYTVDMPAWITGEKVKEGYNFTLTENTTGNARKGTVIFKSQKGTKEITFVQFGVNDIAGTYEATYSTFGEGDDWESETVKIELLQDEENEAVFYADGLSSIRGVVLPLKFDGETYQLSALNGQYLGFIESQKWYLYTIVRSEAGYVHADTSLSYPAIAELDVDDEELMPFFPFKDKKGFSFTGETGTIKSFIDAIGVYVFASKSPTFGNNNNLGYYDIFKDLSIKKIKADH